MNIRAFGGNILVELNKPVDKIGSIVLPQSCSEPQNFGRVVSIGKQAEKESGFKVGYVLVFERFSQHSVFINEKEYCFVRYNDVLGVIE